MIMSDISEDATEQRQVFLFNLISKITLYNFQYSSDVHNLSCEIISFISCLNQIKSHKNLINQFEKTDEPNKKVLDKLYTELTFLTAAYQHAIFIKQFNEAPN